MFPTVRKYKVKLKMLFEILKFSVALTETDVYYGMDSESV